MAAFQSTYCFRKCKVSRFAFKCHQNSISAPSLSEPTQQVEHRRCLSSYCLFPPPLDCVYQLEVWNDGQVPCLHRTVRNAEAEGGLLSPLLGTQVYCPESSGTVFCTKRLPSTKTRIRDWRWLKEGKERELEESRNKKSVTALYLSTCLANMGNWEFYVSYIEIRLYLYLWMRENGAKHILSEFREDQV